jgi:flagellar hook-length control protein FliK
MMPTSTPAIAEAAATPPAATPAAATGTPAFDAILMLQNIAATTECLDTAGLEAGDTAELIGDSADEDDDSDDLEASLAFLSELLAVTSPKGSARDSDAGAESQGEPPEQSPQPVTIKLDSSLLDAANDESAAGADDSAGASLLTAVRPELLDTRTAGDASQNLARAAELLAAAQRPGAATHDKPVLRTPVQDPRWADELGTRVTLMVRGGESTASLQLTPLDLGPVEVNVTVRESQATVHFGASQAETRALLEASLPRLRELLAAQGYQLTDSSVSSGFARSQRQDAAPAGRAAGEAETATTEARPLRSLNLLDVYV